MTTRSNPSCTAPRTAVGYTSDASPYSGHCGDCRLPVETAPIGSVELESSASLVTVSVPDGSSGTGVVWVSVVCGETADVLGDGREACSSVAQPVNHNPAAHRAMSVIRVVWGDISYLLFYELVVCVSNDNVLLRDRQEYARRRSWLWCMTGGTGCCGLPSSHCAQ